MSNYSRLKVAIDDVLPLNVARRDAIGASGHQRFNFDGFIYIRFAAPPYSAGSLIIAYTEDS